jgi:excisionase family DNA binding protein
MNEPTFCGNQLLVTSKEAAKALAISERSLWQFAADGQLPRVRMGRSVRFDIRDLKAFVDGQKERASVNAAQGTGELAQTDREI